MFKRIISFLDNIFVNPEKPISAFSSQAIQHKALFFTNKTSYSIDELNLFKSIFGRSLLLDKTDTLNVLLESFFNNLKTRENYKYFIADLLLSAFKTKKYDHISSITYIYNKNYIYFHKNEKCFQKQCHKMFYLAKKDHILMQILLNAYCFSWFIKTFDFDNLIYPVIYSSIKNKEYKMYESVLNSLNYKANHCNRGIYSKSAFIAIKYNNFDFFNECEHSLPVLKDNLKSREEREVTEYLFKFLNTFVEEKNQKAVQFVLNRMTEMNVSLLSTSNYFRRFDFIIRQLKNLKDSDIFKDYISKLEFDFSLFYSQNVEEIDDLKESLFSTFYYINNERLNNLFHYSFLPNENFIIKFFQTNYSTDNNFLNFIYENSTSRCYMKTRINKSITIAKTKEKFNTF